MKSTLLEVELVRNVGNRKDYKVTYCGLEYDVVVVGTTYNYQAEQIEDRIPEQVLDFVEGWLGGTF